MTLSYTEKGVTDPDAMRQALALALHGWGRVAPNPLVGAVLLRDGEVIGEGWHAEFGGPHAEIAALASCRDPRDATCIVNLEPCAHHGKTPPCADALIAAGIRRVVVALRDPSAMAAGGLERLRGAGVEVEVGERATEAALLNAPFLWNVRRPDRPFVAVKVATSLDGFLADMTGRARWVSTAQSREYVHWLRAGFDAIAVGRRTAESDDPELTVRGAVTPRVPPQRVIFSRGGPVRRDLGLVRSADRVPTIVITDPGARALAEEALRGSAVQVVSAEGRRAQLAALRQLGIGSILVEGGGNLVTALLADGLVDRVYWFQAPIWLGSGTRAFGDRTPTPLDEAQAWVVTERRAIGRDTLLVVDRELCLPGS